MYRSGRSMKSPLLVISSNQQNLFLVLGEGSVQRIFIINDNPTYISVVVNSSSISFLLVNIREYFRLGRWSGRRGFADKLPRIFVSWSSLGGQKHKLGLLLIIINTVIEWPRNHTSKKTPDQKLNLHNIFPTGNYCTYLVF
jgi:hypothetical protein